MATDRSRREFLRLASLGITTVAASQLLSACGVETTSTTTQTASPSSIAASSEETPSSETQSPTTESNASPTQETPSLLVARGSEPEKMVRQGIKALGGIERFMKSGADVIIKPNLCVGYHSYEYAATTNPWVVGALVKICIEGGASRVRVMDYGFGGTTKQCYTVTGVQDQVIAAGGEMEEMSMLKFVETPIPNAENMSSAFIYEDILKADLLINVPIAKNHGMATLTLGLKNLMGTMLYRERIHPSFEKNLVDLATLVRPQLTVIDAIRTLMANGPTGGNLADVKQQDTLIFSPDIVAADSYATRLFDMTPEDIPYIMNAGRRGLGMSDLSGVNIQEINTNA